MPCPHSDDGDFCAICKQEGEEGGMFRFLTCAHKFHKYCIDGYAEVLKQQEGEDEMPLRCPICKEGRIPSETVARPILHPFLAAKSSRGASERPLPNSREQNQPLN